MKKSAELDPLAPRPNLDFSKGVRGKHVARLKRGSNVVVLAPDLMDAFPDSASVNEALRNLKTIADRSARKPQGRLSAPARRSVRLRG